EKAGESGWKALVPGLNFVMWAELVGRTKWHAAWLLFPIVNIFIYAGLCIDLIRSFGQDKFWQSVVAVVLAPVTFFYLGLRRDYTYDGPILVEERSYKAKIVKAQKGGNRAQLKKLIKQNPFHKNGMREWTESIIFAVFAAAFIRMFLIEMYKIPTSSMEGSLLVGDFLCVSKAHYGVRMPMTIAMIPLLHNRIPFLDKESYLDKPKLSYARLPSIEKIEHNDPVVFNYPEGDSVIISPGRTYSVYDVRRGNVPSHISMESEIVVRPMDKMDHYIKRCIGLPGDSLQIIDRQVHLNGVAVENPTNMQFAYIVQSQGGPLNVRKLAEWGVNLNDSRDPIFMLNAEHVEKIKGMGNVTVSPLPQQPRPLFPYDQNINAEWTVDNYGPIYIPKKGTTVPISPSTIAPFKRVISKYEQNDLEIRDGKVYINGSEATDYTFKLDYYWMMGDNRHNSEDSRVWGFVPQDHVVGKPLFIWFSTQDGSMANGIRWSRLFTSAKKP
ncbi:MAG: signal peptidase I, partial [Saprospiraceae bacterium]|nr:signal peptidase I [Saprospiraceae bacterium]